jgi:hypothetical protein
LSSSNASARWMRASGCHSAIAMEIVVAGCKLSSYYQKIGSMLKNHVI